MPPHSRATEETMPTVFRAVNLGLTPEKRRPCSHCFRFPQPEENNFPVCARCKIEAFCSKNCQRLGWTIHRPICTFQMSTQVYHPVSQPDQKHLLLENFLADQSWYTHKSIHSAILMNGGFNSFDFVNSYIHFEARYRPECRGNSSKSYHFLSAEVLPIASIVRPKLAAIIKLRQASHDQQRQYLQSKSVNHKLVLAAFGTEHNTMIHAFEIFDDPRTRAYVSTLRHGNWFQRLQSMTDNGCSFRCVKDSTLHGRWVPGRLHMEKGGSQWRWKELIAEELVLYGFERDFGGFVLDFPTF